MYVIQSFGVLFGIKGDICQRMKHPCHISLPYHAFSLLSLGSGLYPGVLGYFTGNVGATSLFRVPYTSAAVCICSENIIGYMYFCWNCVHFTFTIIKLYENIENYDNE